MTVESTWKLINDGDPLEHLGKQVQVRGGFWDERDVDQGVLALEDWDQDIPLITILQDSGKRLCFYWYDEWRLL